MSLKKVSIVCGGLSTEHDISVCSAQSIAQNIDRSLFDVSVLYVTHQLAWCYLSDVDLFVNEGVASLSEETAVRVLPALLDGRSVWQSCASSTDVYPVDMVFPMIHGTTGEDGLLQGVLEWLRVPYVGADVLSSAICMDKEIAKRLLQGAGLPVVPWLLAHPHADHASLYEQAVGLWGLPFFLKANAQGSSIGVFQVSSRLEYDHLIKDVFQYDSLALLEPAISGREIECAVLGIGDVLEVAQPGEVKAPDHFYSFDAKYLNSGAETTVPADLPAEQCAAIQRLALDSFKALRCQGMARVDLFLDQDGELYVNEVNTLPGFTEISLYPKMWGASHLSYTDLLTKLLCLAEDRHALTTGQQERMLLRVAEDRASRCRSENV